MHGIRRVLVFCILTTVLPTMLLVIPLYLRHSFYANVAYAVTESDILEITDGISTIFCSEHTLQMNGTFNAFQMAQKPEITSYRKHIRLKKSMNLPDDTLEYWGFYLLKGATVALSVCSRFQGASILVVKGERNLRTCGMLEHNTNKQIAQGIFLPEANRQVKITFESNAQEINSNESVVQMKHAPSHNVEEDDIDQNMLNAHNIQDKKNLEDTSKNNTGSTSSPNAESIVERINENELKELFQTAEMYIQKHTDNHESKQVNKTRRLRHARKRHHKEQALHENNKEARRKQRKNLKHLFKSEQNVGTENPVSAQNAGTFSTDKHNRLVRILQHELNSRVTDAKEVQDEDERETKNKILNYRRKRSQELVKPPSLLDQGIKHGGNAVRNFTESDGASSVSSFENGLFNCYGGSILLAREFAPSDQCTNVSYLLSGKHMQTRHNVVEDGYYYYIFYSDNDFVSNDIHALFDIYKPTFQYENVTKSCINQTECSFSLSLMSPDRVIVEIPTKDGIEHEIDDVSLLISVCHPRMGAYIIFPIAVLLFILSCAFM